MATQTGKPITGVTAITSMATTDKLFVNNGGDIKQIELDKAVNCSASFKNIKNVLNYNNAGIHNAIYRGKNLGTSFTAAQSTAIRNGTFADIFVGDYWVINGTTYYVADCDYMLRCGDTDLTAHHVLIVPAGTLYNGVMNDSNTTAGAYVGSKMYASGLDAALAKFKKDFGEGHILGYKNLLVNTTANGMPSNWAWYTRYCDLMNEEMAYGCRAWSQTSQNGYDTGCQKSQLSLFKHRHDLIHVRGQWYWLRSVRSASDFCLVAGDGGAGGGGASGSGGVRPFFLIY